ncbi:MAG: DUF4149 domain-containing protein [Aquabacterium sp.]|nr:DUF4149 domain-containing protein [Aquabacterium sp.]
MKLLRFQAWLAAVWTGITVAVGGLAAPAAFLVLERDLAGKVAGRMFTLEAKLVLGLAIVSFLIERRRVRDLAESGRTASVMTGNLLLILGALFLAIFGEFVLHPMIEASKAGQPVALSFAALHGLSSALYWVRAVMVGCLAWRLTAHQP